MSIEYFPLEQALYNTNSQKVEGTTREILETAYQDDLFSTRLSTYYRAEIEMCFFF